MSVDWLGGLSTQLDAWIDEALQSANYAPSPSLGLSHIIEYQFGRRTAELQPLAVPLASGKRLRPAMALLACEAACGPAALARDAAVALELVHNFSLVHDDAQDRSDVRRSRPTVWHLWGDAQAINVGDGLWALAQIVVVRSGTASAAAQAAVLANAVLRMVEGQFQDIYWQNSTEVPTRDGYLAMIDGKTAALFEAACRMGVIAAGGSDDMQAAFACFGQSFGRAFQMRDDILGVWASQKFTGKPWAQDVFDRKRSLPAVLALTRSDAPAWLLDLYLREDADPLSAATVSRVVEHFESSGVRAEATALLKSAAGAAQAALRAAGPLGSACERLQELCLQVEAV